jgi:hypothetical protein
MTQRFHSAMRDTPVKEGPVAKAIESVTARLPSDLFLWAGLGVLATSFAFSFGRKRDTALAIEPLAPVLLLLGLYNKLVKIEGHDQESTDPSEYR